MKGMAHMGKMPKMKGMTIQAKHVQVQGVKPKGIKK